MIVLKDTTALQEAHLKLNCLAHLEHICGIRVLKLLVSVDLVYLDTIAFKLRALRLLVH